MFWRRRNARLTERLGNVIEAAERARKSYRPKPPRVVIDTSYVQPKSRPATIVADSGDHYEHDEHDADVFARMPEDAPQHQGMDAYDPDDHDGDDMRPIGAMHVEGEDLDILREAVEQLELADRREAEAKQREAAARDLAEQASARASRLEAELAREREGRIAAETQVLDLESAAVATQRELATIREFSPSVDDVDRLLAEAGQHAAAARADAEQHAERAARLEATLRESEAARRTLKLQHDAAERATAEARTELDKLRETVRRLEQAERSNAAAGEREAQALRDAEAALAKVARLEAEAAEAKAARLKAETRVLQAEQAAADARKAQARAERLESEAAEAMAARDAAEARAIEAERAAEEIEAELTQLREAARQVDLVESREAAACQREATLAQELEALKAKAARLEQGISAARSAANEALARLEETELAKSSAEQAAAEAGRALEDLRESVRRHEASARRDEDPSSLEARLAAEIAARQEAETRCAKAVKAAETAETELDLLREAARQVEFADRREAAALQREASMAQQLEAAQERLAEAQARLEREQKARRETVARCERAEMALAEATGQPPPAPVEEPQDIIIEERTAPRPSEPAQQAVRRIRTDIGAAALPAITAVDSPRKSDAPSGKQSRRDQRVASRMPVTIWRQGMQQAVSCTLIDKSASGARIELAASRFGESSNNIGLAEGDKFTLTFATATERTSVASEVVWVEGKRAGLRYCGPFQTQPVAKPRKPTRLAR